MRPESGTLVAERPVEAPPPALELIDVRAAYGQIEVLHGVSLTVPRGTVVALLGPNGAGKTTTIRVASGLMRPTQGCLHIAGKHLNGASPDSLARAGVCTIPEGRGIFPNLSVKENLILQTPPSKKVTVGIRSRGKGPLRTLAFPNFPSLTDVVTVQLNDFDQATGG